MLGTLLKEPVSAQLANTAESVWFRKCIFRPFGIQGGQDSWAFEEINTFVKFSSKPERQFVHP